jgi:hypothetical protein
MRDKSKDTPTFEEIKAELGLDKMPFMSEMLRPDQHEVRDEGEIDPSIGQTEEQQFINSFEEHLGRKLTPEEKHLAVEQARSIGEL